MLYFQCRCWLPGGTIGKMEPQFLYHEISEITRVPCTIWTSNLSIIQPVSHLMMPRWSARFRVAGSWSIAPPLRRASKGLLLIFTPKRAGRGRRQQRVLYTYRKCVGPRAPPMRRPAWQAIERGKIAFVNASF